MRTLAVSTVLWLPLLILAACGPGAEDVVPESAPAGPEVYVTRGEVLAIAADGDPPTLTLRHEAVDGFMDAMTMPFAVGAGVSMADIAEGDKVRFTLTVDAEADEPVVITALEKLPADAALDVVVEQPPAP